MCFLINILLHIGVGLLHFCFIVTAALNELECNGTSLLLSWNSLKEAFLKSYDFIATIQVAQVLINIFLINFTAKMIT